MSELVSGQRNPNDLFEDKSRALQMGLIFQRDEQNNVIEIDNGEGEMVPQIRGVAFHQHSHVPMYTENGISMTDDCDYVVFDLPQIMQLKMFLASIDIRPEG